MPARSAPARRFAASIVLLAACAAGLWFFLPSAPHTSLPPRPSITVSNTSPGNFVSPSECSLSLAQPLPPAPGTSASAAASTPRLNPPDPEAEARVADLLLHLLSHRDGTLLNASDQAELSRRLSASPAATLAWVAHSTPPDRAERLFFAAAIQWATLDFDAAWSWAIAQPDSLPALAVLCSAPDPLAAATRASAWVDASPETSLYRFDFLTRLWRELGQHEPNLVFADSLRPEYRSIAFHTALEHFARDQPSRAYAYALLQPTPAEQSSALLAVISGWPDDKLADLRQLAPALRDPDAARLAAHRLNQP